MYYTGVIKVNGLASISLLIIFYVKIFPALIDFDNDLGSYLKASFTFLIETHFFNFDNR